jgi:hypothetical protein
VYDRGIFGLLCEHERDADFGMRALYQYYGFRFRRWQDSDDISKPARRPRGNGRVLKNRAVCLYLRTCNRESLFPGSFT